VERQNIDVSTLEVFKDLQLAGTGQSNTKLEPEDDQVEKHFLATHSRDENGTCGTSIQHGKS